MIHDGSNWQTWIITEVWTLSRGAGQCYYPYNGGMGTNEKLSVSKQTLATFDGATYQVRADLNLDQRLDLIFTSFSMDHDPVRVFIQDSTGKFNETANAFPDLDPIKS